MERDERTANEEEVFGQVLRGLETGFFQQRKKDMYRVVISAVEKPLIEMVLERAYGNQIRAARILGINRNTLRAKIRKLGIDVTRWKNLY